MDYKIIPNFSNYMINEYGEIISKLSNGRIIKPYVSKNKYLATKLINDNGITKHCLIHRLVATTFIPNQDNKPEVNHIDGNVHNNYYKNLEWVTRKENLQHAYQILGRTPIRNKKQCELYYNDKLINTFDNIKKACRYAQTHYNISFTMLEKHRKHKQCRLNVL